MTRTGIAGGIAAAAAAIALAVGLALHSPARADDGAAAGGAQTWRGEVVDLACYLAKGAKGEGHRKCAQMCAAQGQPVGLLTDDGKLFLLVGEHGGAGLDEAKKLCGSTAEVTGVARERDGLRAIEVQSAKGAKS